MTFRVVIGIDPGQSGALAVLADGEYAGFGDMPVKPRKAGGEEVDGASLAQQLRAVRARYPGASFIAAVELVSAMPGKNAEGGRQSIGASSAFRFGEGFGVIKGVLQAIGLDYVLVAPVRWKRYLGLLGSEKDDARQMAIRLVPAAAQYLQRKKDGGRADALLLAVWAWQTEAQPQEQAA